MGLGFRIRTIMAAAAVSLCAGSAVVLAAPGASAAPASGLSLSVNFTTQAQEGGGYDWGIVFNMTITNNTGASVTMTSVDAPNYDPLTGAPAAGTVLPTGASTFTGILGGAGPGPLAGQVEAPIPLVLTVNTSGGSVTWNQSVSDPQVVTNIGGADLTGSFDVADCSQYYFEYGTSTAYGQQAGLTSANCPNDGTTTEVARTPLPAVQPGAYHYRVVVIQSNGTALYGQDEPFQVKGTTVPVGSVGVIGLAALAGCALFVTQRGRRTRRLTGRR